MQIYLPHRRKAFQASRAGTSPGTGSLVAWYDFVDATDSHSTFDLDVLGTAPTYTSDADGTYASCLDGAPGRGFRQTSLDDSWANTDADWSLVVRYRPTTSLANDDYVSSNGSRWRVRYSAASGGGWAVKGANIEETLITTPTPATNTWFLAVVVHDGTADTTTRSFDGATLSSVGSTGTYGLGIVYIGATGASNTTDVDIDFAGFFSKKLSQDEVDWLYNAGGTTVYSDI